MALDQSALLQLTDALRSADGGEVMRRLLHTMLQALIDAEATAHIGAGPHSRTGPYGPAWGTMVVKTVVNNAARPAPMPPALELTSSCLEVAARVHGTRRTPF